MHLPISLRGHYFVQNGPGAHGSVVNPLDAAGDFPNVVPVDANTLLINRVSESRNHTELVVFDLAREQVRKVCRLPHTTGDVVSKDGRFAVYATTDEVVIYDLSRERVLRTYPIPPRFRNFHASLLRAPRRW